MHWFKDSKLFDLARQGQRLTHIAAVIPLSFVFSFVAQMGAIPVFVVIMVLYGFNEDAISMKGILPLEAGFWMGAQLVSAFILVYFILWLWVALVEKRRLWTMGYELKHAIPQYLRGFLIGAVMFSGAVGFLALFGAVEVEAGDPSQVGFAALGGVMIVLVGWIVQGGAEEALTRGWVLPVIGARYKPWIGLLVSSLIFAIMHGLNPGLNAIALLNLALFGVFAGLYAMREGSLWGISALHSVWNWIQGNFFGFQVSGMDVGGGSLLNLKTVGADWLTGGAFGPEGGAAVTMILIVSIAVTILWKSKNSKAGL
ncbi:MAG: CPBP family intramembrane metalloprotease [Anaerolineales bacterium]|nr:CPBP family intramembrane metalloprotease [Anaerolineales bacterium]